MSEVKRCAACGNGCPMGRMVERQGGGPMSARLMQILASLAQRRALRTLDTICETQHQISTRKLEQYLEPIGDELAGHAFHLRIEYDALTSKVATLEAENAKLRAELAVTKDQRDAAHDSLGGLQAMIEGQCDELATAQAKYAIAREFAPKISRCLCGSYKAEGYVCKECGSDE